MRRLVLGLAVVAVAAPVAQARVDENGSGGGTGAALSGVPTAGDNKGDLAPTSASELPVAGDYKIGLIPASPDLATHPDNRAVRYGPGFNPTVGADVLVTAEPSSGFDWGDAGIGAGMLFAVMLLVAGGLVATRHLRHAATA